MKELCIRVTVCAFRELLLFFPYLFLRAGQVSDGFSSRFVHIYLPSAGKSIGLPVISRLDINVEGLVALRSEIHNESTVMVLKNELK